MVRSGNSHIIKKQVLDIEANFNENIYELQNNIRDLFYARMLPLIEEVCNYYDTGDIVRIDQLTIDVGEVSLKSIDEELTRKFEARLHEQMSKLFYKEKNSEFGQTETKVERISADLSDLELLMSFLKTGILPWWKRNSEPVNLGNIFLEQIKKKPVVMKKIISSQVQNKLVLKRIVLQFSEMITEQIIVLYRDGQTPGINRFISNLERLLLKIVREDSLNSAVVKMLRQELILIYAENVSVPLTEKKITARFITVLEVTDPSYKKTVKTLFKIAVFPTPAERKEYGTTFLKALKEQMTHLLPADFVSETFVPGKQANDLREKEQSKKEEQSKIKLTKKNEIKEQKENESIDHEETQTEKKISRSETTKKSGNNVSEELYIKNSGLVLIWSYLPHYFKHVGLLVDGMFTDEQAKHRAAHLLQYMVTGETTSPEYELPLNKILCGIPVEEPLETGIIITESEVLEAECMLQTVIDHWGGLGKSSPLALRQTFLNRDGVLFAENNSWILRVQDSGMDILLNKIPWSYSVVNLKWMEKPIYVEWQ